MHEELVHEETRAGFKVRLYFREEVASPRGQFMTEDGEDDEELLADIESGRYMWFCAKVTVSKAGVTLGTDYLGCCCYEGELYTLLPRLTQSRLGASWTARQNFGRTCTGQRLSAPLGTALPKKFRRCQTGRPYSL